MSVRVMDTEKGKNWLIHGFFVSLVDGYFVSLEDYSPSVPRVRSRARLRNRAATLTNLFIVVSVIFIHPH